jgi:hypothetical protein
MQAIIFVGIQASDKSTFYIATRRRIKIDMELPMKDDYSVFIRDLLLREHPELQ